MIWCAITIAIIILLLFPILILIVYFGGQDSDRKANRLVSFGTKILLLLWGIRVVQHNRELVDTKNNQYIYVANHRSDLDGIVTYSMMGGDFKFIGKKQLLTWPFFGFLVGKLHVTVDRSNPESRKESIVDMVRAVKGGASMMVHAEGWCNFSDDYVLPLKKGAFRLATETGLPIAVYTLVGIGEIWPKTTLRLRPGTVHVYWESVIQTTGMQEEDEPALMEQVSSIWEKRLRTAYPDGYRTTDLKQTFEAWQAGQLKKKIRK
ncbi:MAG: 1-acyl-sn-glycerol-3-phosphate acyltransferase [Bacteroidetes bacterium]|nr:1-acyl-sn-glycerol-3-phosphate acyltransferase [Bacteroidota bacterium]